MFKYFTSRKQKDPLTPLIEGIEVHALDNFNRHLREIRDHKGFQMKVDPPPKGVDGEEYMKLAGVAAEDKINSRTNIDLVAYDHDASLLATEEENAIDSTKLNTVAKQSTQLVFRLEPVESPEDFSQRIS